MTRDSSRTISIRYPGITLPWFTLWIFTVAFAHLGFGRGVAALLLWPYYLGDALATLAGVR